MKLNKKGFTLVELLAVIVVLAIIALIGTVSMNAVFDSARKSTAAANAAALKSATKNYCQSKMMMDNGEAPTSATDTDIQPYYDGNGAIATATEDITISNNCQTIGMGTVSVTLSGKTYSCSESSGKWSCS